MLFKKNTLASHEYTIHWLREQSKCAAWTGTQEWMTNTTCSSIGLSGINTPGAGDQVNEWMWWMNDSRLARRWLCCREERWDPDRPCWAERPAWARPWAPEEGGDWSFSLSQDDSLPPEDSREREREMKWESGSLNRARTPHVITETRLENTWVETKTRASLALLK